MAFKDKALFLYGFDVTDANKYINFKNAFAGPVLTAVMRLGNYTATEFLAEAKRAMEEEDGVNTYTWSIDRTVMSNTSNQVTVLTSGSFLEIYFATGVNSANSPRDTLGFGSIDLTGATQYTGSTNAGIILIPEFPTYDYLGPDEIVENDGVKNVSAYGIKETLVFAQNRFFQGSWKYISNFNGRTQKTEWADFLKYAVKQLKFEFSPSIYEDPDLFYQCTLETTTGNSNGMGYTLKQMLGQSLYRFYETGTMKFRVNPS